MVVFNYSGAEINAKIVYYGPALSGKTTNLEYIYAKMPAHTKGKMVSMKTRTDRTLFFDYLPLELGEINGYRTRILLYTVPGQVYYNATRKLVLKGADAVVFVADSDPAKMQDNVDSLRNLEENLNEHGLTLDTIPWVLQYNKRDLPNALPIDTLAGKLNLLNVPFYEAVATTGVGIYETFQGIAGTLYAELAERLEKSQPAPAPESRSAKPSAPAAPSQEPPPSAGVGAPKAVPIAESAADDENVSDVVDAALREVDLGDDARDLAEPQRPPHKPVRQEASNPRPSAPPKTTVANKSKDEESFQFESLTDDGIDDKVGRVVNLEDTHVSEAGPADEFITNPFRSGKDESNQPAQQKKPPEEPRPSPVPRKTLSDSEPSVTVPVVLSRSQVRKTIPLKITLEIQIVDEE